MDDCAAPSGGRIVGSDLGLVLERHRIVSALPGMLGAIVADVIRQQPDLELFSAGDDVAAAVGETDAEFVLLDAAGQRECTELLARYPRLKVLSVEDDGRRGFLYELRPHRRPLGEMSPMRLIDALRVSGGVV
jgi:hypothetical protein